MAGREVRRELSVLHITELTEPAKLVLPADRADDQFAVRGHLQPTGPGHDASKVHQAAALRAR